MRLFDRPCRVAAVLLVLLAVSVAVAQTPTSDLHDRRIAQLQAGLAVYENHCARCHDFSRQRRSIEVLATRLGANELAWHDTTERLMHYVSTYMPFDRPGTLDDHEYYDVVAFLLYRAEILQANQIVTEETLDAIALPAFE